MGRTLDKIRKRVAAEKSLVGWRADCARAEAREADRAHLSARLRELSEKVRGGEYPGRREDLAEIDRLWSLAARVTP